MSNLRKGHAPLSDHGGGRKRGGWVGVESIQSVVDLSMRSVVASVRFFFFFTTASNDLKLERIFLFARI